MTCDRCGAHIGDSLRDICATCAAEEADDGPDALPDEFPNDDETCDFTEEDVVT